MEKQPPWLRRKEINKRLRVVLPAAVLLLILAMLVKMLFFGTQYQTAANILSQTSDTGFVALSFGGVNREGAHNLFASEQLAVHLNALKHAGYVTVSQRDIAEYYKSGSPLPDKALFLMFEDGSRDTAVFAQPLLERHNFQATMFTYASGLESNSTNILLAKDLKKLDNNTYWEIGSNGYRFAYINVFDSDGNFLDILSPAELQTASLHSAKSYDHYLMDFIRDASGIPKETPQEMRQRISQEYENMRELYSAALDNMPGAYILMHANSACFGTNEQVGQVNTEWIAKLFDISFNREGSALNTHQGGAYDLTRMQIKSHWPANHLLMRIQDDTRQRLQFEAGDAARGAHWELLYGAAEFKAESIVLTTLPRGGGLLCWNGSAPESFGLSTELGGVSSGTQTLYLCADKELEQYLALRISDNALSVSEKTPGGSEALLYQGDLIRQAGSDSETPPGLGVEESVWQMNVILAGQALTILVDGRSLVADLPIGVTGGGHILLGAEASEEAQADPVYDGIFTNLMVYSLQDGAQEAVLYDNRTKGFERLAKTVGKAWNSVVSWFVTTL